MPPQTSASGIVTTATGERQIPESKRADGSTRKAIKVRPGYEPPEDVAKFRINGRQDATRAGVVPGAEGLQASKAQTLASTNKNVKRREARKRAKVAAAVDHEPPSSQTFKEPEPKPVSEPVDPQGEKDKKARNLRKKLRQARELKSRRDGGDSLLPEQLEKVIKISQLIQELEALGFDSSGEPKRKDPSNGISAAPS